VPGPRRASDRSVVRVAVVFCAEGCALTVRVAQRAQPPPDSMGGKMKERPVFGGEPKRPAAPEVGVVAGEHVVRAGPSEGLENRVRTVIGPSSRAHWRRFGGADDPAGKAK